ncbi:MAG: hypothetical protein ACLPWG_09730, partial [Steroidobacteraceae bacterium]
MLIFVLATLAIWLWVRSHPSAPAPAKIALTELPEIAGGARISAKRIVEPAAARTKTGEFEVCGVGKVKIDPDDATAMGNYLEVLAKKSHLRWFSALRNSDDLRARAAGLFLQGTIADRGADQVVMQEARDELVQLAVGANDPAVYALAIYKCAKNEDPAAGACRQVSAAGWARMDPDNAIPWLLVVGQARANNDMQAEADAFYHAAQAHSTDAYYDSVFSFAEPEIPKDV